MTILLHVSDAHFGTERPAAVEALIGLAHALRPDLLILSGDLTQRARRAQFAAARAFVDRLGVPATLAVPGNHDIPLYNVVARALHPYARYRDAFGDVLEPIFESPELLVIGVNTTRPYRHKHGALSAAQINHVAARLERADPAQLRIVVVHQPIAVTLARHRSERLRGHGAAITRWSASGADLILGGHLHLPYVAGLHGHEGADPLPRRLWAVQAGTAVSSRLRHEVNNSINVIRYDGRAQCAAIERWDFREDRSCFQIADTRDVQVDRGARD